MTTRKKAKRQGRPPEFKEPVFLNMRIERALADRLDAWVEELRQGIAGKAINRAALMRDILERACAEHESPKRQ